MKHAVRATTVEKGRDAEARAIAALVDDGYVIVAQNVRRAGGEIDVIAREGDTLCFIEVRSRKTARFGNAASTVGTRKQARVMRAASAYLAAIEGAPPRCRFDVVTVDGEREGATIAIVKDAFRVSS